MPRSALMIASLAIGLTLSIALPGCAHLRTDPPAPAAVAVAVKDTPPSYLLVCPAAPEGFPADAQATMPPAVRFAAIRLATAFAAVRAQLDRLIEWHAPASCTTVHKDR